MPRAKKAETTRVRKADTARVILSLGDDVSTDVIYENHIESYKNLAINGKLTLGENIADLSGLAVSYKAYRRSLGGKDAPVIAFLEANANAREMLADIRDYVEKWLPCFVRDNRAYLTVAIGCTGGQHRSVYFAEQLAARFAASVDVLVRHREMR